MVCRPSFNHLVKLLCPYCGQWVAISPWNSKQNRTRSLHLMSYQNSGAGGRSVAPWRLHVISECSWAETSTGGPVVKNLPSHAGDKGSVLGQGTKTPHATGQLSPHSATRQSPRTMMKTQHGQNKKQTSNEWNICEYRTGMLWEHRKGSLRVCKVRLGHQ